MSAGARPGAEAAVFSRRVYTLPGFLAALLDGAAHLPELARAARGGRVSRAQAEKIMLAVTQVNNCRYCRLGHSYAASRAGVSRAEIESLLAGDWSPFPAQETAALAFARHYAESEEQPDPAAWEALVAACGPAQARDALAYMRMITIGNLLGNTFDALLSRLRGRPALDSRLLDEAGVLLTALGLLLLPAAGLYALARRLL